MSPLISPSARFILACTFVIAVFFGINKNIYNHEVKNVILHKEANLKVDIDKGATSTVELLQSSDNLANNDSQSTFEMAPTEISDESKNINRVQAHMDTILRSTTPAGATFDAINAMPFPEDRESRIELIQRVSISRIVSPSTVAFIARSEFFDTLVSAQDGDRAPAQELDLVTTVLKIYVNSLAEANAMEGISNEETRRVLTKNLGEYLDRYPAGEVHDALVVSIHKDYPDLTRTLNN